MTFVFIVVECRYQNGAGLERYGVQVRSPANPFEASVNAVQKLLAEPQPMRFIPLINGDEIVLGLGRDDESSGHSVAGYSA